MVSVTASWTSVTPPPEYLNAVNGARSIRTFPVFDGFSPLRICTTDGTGSFGL